jgi:hypothetical protein
VSALAQFECPFARAFAYYEMLQAKFKFDPGTHFSEPEAARNSAAAPAAK